MVILTIICNHKCLSTGECVSKLYKKRKEIRLIVFIYIYIFNNKLIVFILNLSGSNQSFVFCIFDHTISDSVFDARARFHHLKLGGYTG